jgi:hypothetical protein
MPFIDFQPSDIAWENTKKCIHPEHNPPDMIVLDPGTHTYQCPACKHETIIVIPKTYC